MRVDRPWLGLAVHMLPTVPRREGLTALLQAEAEQLGQPTTGSSKGIGSSGAGYGNYFLDPGLVFNQARIGAEFGLAPWSTVAFRHPSSQLALAKFWVPATAPYEAELGTYSGSSGCFASWWKRHQLNMTSNGTSSGTPEARPGGLWNNGCDFRVYLEP